MSRDPVLKLNQKPHAIFGIISFVLAIISLVLVVISIVMVAVNEEMTQSDRLAVGILEWISAMLTIAGFGTAVIGETSIDKEKIFAHISIVLHFIGFIYHGTVLWFGFL